MPLKVMTGIPVCTVKRHQTFAPEAVNRLFVMLPFALVIFWLPRYLVIRMFSSNVRFPFASQILSPSAIALAQISELNPQPSALVVDAPAAVGEFCPGAAARLDYPEVVGANFESGP